MDRAKLVERLERGEVIVTFTKKDGTERVMKCTLHEGVIPVIETKGARKPNDEVLAVWDMDKNAWRSFRLDSIKHVE